MSNCGRCDLQRIYKQFAEKKARKLAESQTPAVEEVKELEIIVVPEVKKTTKPRKKKTETVVEVVDTPAEEITSEAVEEKIEE